MSTRNFLSTILIPITTPFENDEISFSRLKLNLDKYNGTEIGGFVVGGSNGETILLTEYERISLIAHVKEHAPPSKSIIAGTGFDSIKATIELTNKSAEFGIDAALVITPSFYKTEMRKEVLFNYYTEVADKAKIPVIIYNVPKFTNVNIEIETVEKLSRHENIIGIKNSTENISEIEQLAKLSSPKFSVLVGTASVLFPGFLVGASGAIVALANIAPKECLQILNLVRSNKLEESKKLQDRLTPVNIAITSKYGVSGLKSAMDLIGYFGGKPRKPLTKLNADQLNDLKQILIRAKLIE